MSLKAGFRQSPPSAYTSSLSVLYRCIPSFGPTAHRGSVGLVQTLDLDARPHARKGPREFGPLHAIWFVPALDIAAVLSIPVALVASTVQKRRERSFKKQMKATGRVMDRRNFEQALQEGRGTVILETTHSKARLDGGGPERISTIYALFR